MTTCPNMVKYTATGHVQCAPKDAVPSVQLLGVCRCDESLKPVRPLVAISDTEFLAAPYGSHRGSGYWHLSVPLNTHSTVTGTLLGEAPADMSEGHTSAVRVGSEVYTAAVAARRERQRQGMREGDAYDIGQVTFVKCGLDYGLDTPAKRGRGRGRRRGGEREQEAPEVEKWMSQRIDYRGPLAPGFLGRLSFTYESNMVPYLYAPGLFALEECVYFVGRGCGRDGAEPSIGCTRYHTETGQWEDVPLPSTLSDLDIRCHKVSTVVVCDTAYVFLFEIESLAHILTYSTRQGWADRTEEGVAGARMLPYTNEPERPWVVGQYVAFVKPQGGVYRLNQRRDAFLTLYDTISGGWLDVKLEDGCLMGRGMSVQTPSGCIAGIGSGTVDSKRQKWVTSRPSPSLSYPSGDMMWARDSVTYTL
ncbi:hypothetical protein KIPB_009300 [Kipferlia bialata]|uniref:Uncharacterized protein n=1 Tax=Kipferlia bialata TaxID=797122 RepID=A0A9K3D3R9_9EUKA|nr:hypothetical protein KIPB_009300 [Kipferlia bialata]|eukprot:g9300.t1